MGDTNRPNICWKFNSAENVRSNKFLTCHAASSVFQKTGEVTRESTVLDLVVPNREEQDGTLCGGGLGLDILRKGMYDRCSSLYTNRFKKLSKYKVRSCDHKYSKRMHFLEAEILKLQSRTIPMRK